MFTNRRPYYGLKMSTTDFFREPVRYLKESNTQESMMEKPYLEDEYPKMHLKLPDFWFKPKEIPSIFGPIAGGDPYPGLAMISFGDAKCGWNITNLGYCTKEPVVITMTAKYFWHAEFKFIAQIVSDTIGVSLTQIEGTEACAWDEQDYLLTFPEDANGSVTVCGFASTHALVSQTFETVVAGMPVGIHLIGGALVPVERGQHKPATLLKSVYGDKGDDCGCITLSSSCLPDCGCRQIGYTTQQMKTNEIQTLSVLYPEDGCTYLWNISSGSGSLSAPSGTSVDYTSPDTNAGCTNNPTITLSSGGLMCDSLLIAVNDSASVDVGYVYEKIAYAGGFPDCTQTTGTCTGCYVNRDAWSEYDVINCDGTTVPSGWKCGDPDNITYWSCTYCDEGADCGDSDCPGPCEYPLQETIRHNCRNTRGNEDQRTENELADGCCPQQLL